MAKSREQRLREINARLIRFMRRGSSDACKAYDIDTEGGDLILVDRKSHRARAARSGGG